MNKLCYFCPCAFLLLASCAGSGSRVDLSPQVDSLTNAVAKQDATIKQMRDSIDMLKFPADQRLAKIKQMIASEDFSGAKNAIAQLQKEYISNFQRLLKRSIYWLYKHRQILLRN